MNKASMRTASPEAVELLRDFVSYLLPTIEVGHLRTARTA